MVFIRVIFVFFKLFVVFFCFLFCIFLLYISISFSNVILFFFHLLMFSSFFNESQQVMIFILRLCLLIDFFCFSVFSSFLFLGNFPTTSLVVMVHSFTIFCHLMFFSVRFLSFLLISLWYFLLASGSITSFSTFILTLVLFGVFLVCHL